MRSKAYCLVKTLGQVLNRPTISHNNNLHCGVCLSHIEVIATKMRLFTQAVEGLIEDTGEMIDVFQIFCPECDTAIDIGPGSIITLDKLGKSPLASTTVAPGVIEYGIVKGKKLQGASRSIVQVKEANFDFQSDFELFCNTWKLPEKRGPIIKAENARLKEAWQQKLLAEWLGKAKKKVMPERRKKGTVTLVINGVSREVEI